ncbi:MAG: hypothetical protein U9N76_05790 [Candidatus Marinimicrobia bacterium]|nr:hypothetical protein [Candidatus Neomarinimicrobiota bacterium]
MSPWELSVNLKDAVLDFTFLSMFLVIGTVLRRYTPFFRKYLIPNNILGGFFALIFGPQILGALVRAWGYSQHAYIPLNGDRLGIYVYHLLAITFISMGLRKEKTEWGKGPLSKSFTSILTYLVQASVGLLVAFALIYTIKPDLFPGIGLLVPMGFGMGPGLAYSIGHNWEKFGFEGGGLVGLTFAAIGYLIAFFFGIGLINYGIRKRKTKLITGMEQITPDIRMGVLKNTEKPIAGKLPLASEAIESLAFQLGLVGTIYLATYGVTFFLTGLLVNAGLTDFASTLWSFHFIIAIIITLSTRKILDMTKRSYVIDTGLMNRITGVAIDYLVVASIAAISITIVVKYWMSLLFMSVFGGIATVLFIYWAAYRAFDNYPFERFVGIFGEMTGTINSALVLYRVMDPQFKTNIAEDAVYGSGISIFIGLPLLIMMNFPMMFWNNQLYGYWYTLGIFAVYSILLLGIWRLIGFLKFRKVLK